jgi:ribosomal protein uL24
MKSDTERKRFYTEKLHRRKNRMHSHLSRDLRGKLKTKKRSILIHKGDKVKVLRGEHKGKEAKIARVSHQKRKVYLEGISATNSRAKESPVAFDPSKILLISLEPTAERKMLFSEDAFKKEAPKKAEKAPSKTVEDAKDSSEKDGSPMMAKEPKASTPSHKAPKEAENKIEKH